MTSGLRRFVGPRPGTAEPGKRPGEQCEMCAEPLAHEHSHVVNTESRSILCTCRSCYLLFTHEGAGGGKHRAIPERYRYAPSFPPGESIWESTGIPVGMAFLFRSSPAGPVAFYPSPAGATESLLSVGAWQEAVDSVGAFADLADDVEALLINKCDAGFECFLVPIDACYQLVGLVRTYWRGFDGGTEARERIETFFDSLRERSKWIEAGDG